jgi:hypothetical protein
MELMNHKIQDLMSMTESGTCTTRLAALISAKLQVLEILQRLSQRQLDLIGAGEMTALVKLLAAKQTVLRQLQTLDQQLDPFRGHDPDQRVWPTAEERSSCQAQADRCNALLREALELEKRAEEAMLDRRDAAARELSTVHVAADARSAYVAPPAPLPIRLHVEG